MDPSFDTGLPVGFNTTVYTIAKQSDGKIIVWWDFTNYKWSPSNRLVRLNSDWSKDFSFNIWSWFIGIMGGVKSLAIQSDGKILVWWDFINYQWSVAKSIIRLNSDWSKDNSFNVWGWFNAFNYVYTIVIQSDWKILAWWDFTTYSWTTINRLIRLNSDGTRDTNFNIWSWFDIAVRKLVVQSDGKIIVWWDFRTYSWMIANGIVRLNSDWSKDTNFDAWSWFNYNVYTITLQSDGKILAWGNFNTYNWLSAKRVIRLNTDGTKDTSLDVSNNSFNSPVRDIAIQSDGKIIVWWEFTTYQLVDINRIVRLNSNGTIDNSFATWEWFDSYVYAISIQSGNKIMAWGSFSNYQWLSANRTIRINADWTKDSSFDIWNGLNWNVRTTVVQSDDKVLIWWNFTNYSWIVANRILRLNSNGTRDNSFNVWNWFNNAVYTLAKQSDGKIIVWWDFSTYSWFTSNKIIRLNPSGTRDTIVHGGPINSLNSSFIRSVVLQTGIFNKSLL